ncbi:hypothetical protein F2Q70_00028962 [Brassica cretica]|uniref:UspA domain-containing protein n=1 Tax=Brassica cretica TaxID=69181 RepID=A0A8S9LAB7_BRACR|nr:hypothetical protein F2Q70_00028962 [Brassica cretica]KAF3554849.1 hypothetical protein F2Q69_00018177 [Brassica cretica]
MATVEEKPLMVVGVDESEQSTYALEWTLDRFFAPYAPNFPFKLLIIHAKPNAVSAVGFAGPGIVEVVPHVDADLKHTAAKVVEKAKGICESKSVRMMRLF